jgi:hypothetical protein
MTDRAPIGEARKMPLDIDPANRQYVLDIVTRGTSIPVAVIV